MKFKNKLLIAIGTVIVCLGLPIYEYVSLDCPNTAGIFVKC